MPQSQSNWIALAVLVLATVLVVKGHGAEGNALIVGAFALLHVDAYRSHQ